MKRLIDATTNLSLILQAEKLPQYQYLIAKLISQSNDDICDHLMVNLDCKILKCIQGVYQVKLMLVYSLILLVVSQNFENHHILIINSVDKMREQIKFATIGSGIKAPKELKEHGINCNQVLGEKSWLRVCSYIQKFD